MLFDCFPILYAPENNKPSEDTARQLLETSDIRNGARWSLAPCQYRLPRGMKKRGREGVLFLVYSRPTVALLLHYSPPPRNRIHAYTSESIGFFAKHTPNERPTDVFAKSKTNNVFYFILNTNIIYVYNTSIIFFSFSPNRSRNIVVLSALHVFNERAWVVSVAVWVFFISGVLHIIKPAAAWLRCAKSKISAVSNS